MSFAFVESENQPCTKISHLVPCFYNYFHDLQVWWVLSSHHIVSRKGCYFRTHLENYRRGRVYPSVQSMGKAILLNISLRIEQNLCFSGKET